MLRKAFAIFTLTLVALTSQTAVARDLDLVDPPPSVFAGLDGKALDVRAARAAIIRGGAQRGWVPSADEPGKITLRNNVRNKHLVVVTVVYNAKTFEIKYADSANMNYAVVDGKPRIHPNYMKWTQALAQDIVSAALTN